MTTTHFYTTGEIGLEYTSAAELLAFLRANDLSWREAMYRTVQTPLAWGEMKTAREIYDLILEVYELSHRDQSGS